MRISNALNGDRLRNKLQRVTADVVIAWQHGARHKINGLRHRAEPFDELQEPSSCSDTDSLNCFFGHKKTPTVWPEFVQRSYPLSIGR